MISSFPQGFLLNSCLIDEKKVIRYGFVHYRVLLDNGDGGRDAQDDTRCLRGPATGSE